MFGPSDILWVRNVKANKGANWAYMDTQVDETFVLHWTKHYKDAKEALKPQIGDLILIFQRPNGFREVQLTHLVTPVSNQFTDCHDSSPDFPWGREVMVIARAEINSVGKSLNFTPVNQGHSYDIKNLAKEKSISEVQQIIWNSFASHLNPEITKQFLQVSVGEESPESFEKLEGKEKFNLKLHLVRERNYDLIKMKKGLSKPLTCESCGFDFQTFFGNHGNGFIECHHKKPIHLGERITSLDDLALVCSNCHRMLHRKSENGHYLTVDQLKTLIELHQKD